jgi:hypothetical protein
MPLRDAYSKWGEGGAIAEVVSRWFPTAALRVRARVWSRGICGGQSGAEAGFLRVLQFPLPIFIPPIVAISGLLYQPQMIGEGDCGAIGGMKIGRGNRSTRRKPAPECM